MAGNTFGRNFVVTTWGESHGPAVGVVIDGCPAGLEISTEIIQAELDRRRPGTSAHATPRREPDQGRILSGVYQGRTLGTPICIVIDNRDVRSGDYDDLADKFRPGHADLTYHLKYGLRDHRGGGRASARETAARVAAGAVAQAWLDKFGVNVLACTRELGGVEATETDWGAVVQNELLSPDPSVVDKMKARLAEVKRVGDSVGGVVEVLVRGCPAGLGEPVFDKLDAALAQAIMSIGAIKSVEIGAGFRAARLLGSENNDPLTPDGFLGNNAGGILGGISTGQNIVIRAAVKPIASIAVEQQTVDLNFQPTTISVTGRHDVSALPRIVPVCQAMVRLVLADHLLRQRLARVEFD
ncbi:MAG: chorismate synthase [Proteobacteria bacterium]|nr:chorismate synthase [Pseudomonadota bacterium]